MTPVYLPEVMALVIKEVTEELVEASLAPDCADSLQPVLAVLVDEEALLLWCSSLIRLVFYLVQSSYFCTSSRHLIFFFG